MSLLSGLHTDFNTHRAIKMKNKKSYESKRIQSNEGEAMKMSRVLLFFGGLLVGFAVAWPSTANALPSAEKCAVGKIKQVRKYLGCRLEAEWKALARGTSPDFSKCDQYLQDRWPRIESRAGLSCPTSGDQREMRDEMAAYSDSVAFRLSGMTTTTTLPPVCGNGAVEAGEECEFGDLMGMDCASLPGFVGGELRCTPELCTFDTSGCYASRYEDTGLTLIDNATGLEWEKKQTAVGSGADALNLHDVDNLYSWYDAVSSWIGAVNVESFAGHSDWRVPSVDELVTLIDYTNSAPSVDAGFLPQQGNFYWTSSTLASGRAYAWTVNFRYGAVNDGVKASALYLRAVRNAR